MNGVIVIFFKKYWRALILFILAVIFFIGSSAFNYFTQQADFVKWLSPDETANYTFTKLYAETGDLRFFEKYNLYAGDIIHPRSFRSDAGKLKPVSFLGIIFVYGKIAALTGYKTIPYLTPFFAALGIVFFYLFIKKIFGPTHALIAATLLTFFPPYFYYASRSMFHNVPFVVFLIAGLYFAVIMTERKRYVLVSTDGEEMKKKKIRTARLTKILHHFIYPALAGGLIGLAATMRTSELLWLAPALFIAWLFNIRRVGLVKLLVFLSFFTLAFLPVFYWNQLLYGAPLASGYAELNRSLAVITKDSPALLKATIARAPALQQELLKRVKEAVFYFGFRPKQSLRMFYYYFFRMFNWLFWFSLLGFFAFLFSTVKIRARQLIYLLCLAAAGLILLLYYGSWEFHDNPDPRLTTIGNSYTRYWLPLYLGLLPLSSLFIVRASRIFKNKIFIVAVRVFVVLLVAITSLQFVLIGSNEGLIFTGRLELQARQEAARIFRLTEDNSVIITRYHDKLLFPERKVIVGLFDDDTMNKEYARLAGYLPLYYYNFALAQNDLNYLNETKLAAVGLQIKKIENITSEFTLYKLYRKTEENKEPIKKIEITYLNNFQFLPQKRDPARPAKSGGKAVAISNFQ